MDEQKHTPKSQKLGDVQPTAASEVAIHTLIMMNLVNPATCAACPKTKACQIGILYARGDIPHELDVFQRRKVLCQVDKDFAVRLPNLWCMLSDDSKHHAELVRSTLEVGDTITFEFVEMKPEVGNGE